MLENLFFYETPDAVFNCFGVKGSPLRAKNNPVDFFTHHLKSIPKLLINVQKITFG
jgi:hypothetical protein